MHELIRVNHCGGGRRDLPPRRWQNARNALQSTQQSSPSSSQSPVVIQSKHCAALHGCCSALCAEPWTLGWFWLVKIFSRLIVTEADSHVARRFSTKVLSGSHSKLQPISVSQPGQAASFLQPRWAPRRQ